MSKYESGRIKNIAPYEPGEQPKERKYIKLNTNESPFPPSPFALRLSRESAGDLLLYPDPEYTELVKTASEKLGVLPENIIFGNGSDEILNYAFIAFCDKNIGACFPDISYGFYKVFAEINGVPYTEIPLKDDFTIDIKDYFGVKRTVFIANPNAPTGIILSPADIEKIVKNNPDNVVVVDEAYIDFGGESSIFLTEKYKNLLVVQTFSKSRSLAGARLGFAVGDPSLIADIKKVKYSNNPYNVNRMTASAGVGALIDEKYFRSCCGKIVNTREKAKKELIGAGFTVTDSKANFLFISHKKTDGKYLYEYLKENGVLVRFFNKARLDKFVRMTVGNDEDTEKAVELLIKAVEKL